MKHRYRTGALLACWAVLFRQTNAVWVCFIIGVCRPPLACNRVVDRTIARLLIAVSRNACCWPCLLSCTFTAEHTRHQPMTEAELQPFTSSQLCWVL